MFREKIFYALMVVSPLFCVKSVAQSSIAPPPNLLPTITAPSPEASAFARYGNYEPNLFNGTVDVSIPLYEIKVGQLRVPISISYNTSGIRVTDVPTYIGLGWSLNAGGVITRKVMGGLPDEYSISPSNAGYFGYLNGGTTRRLYNGSFDVGSEAGLEYLKDVADRHRIDAEPDIFSYNIPGKSGKFVFSQEDSLKPVFIPYQPLKVLYTPGQGTANMTMGITDESGINYQFDKSETSEYSQQVLGTISYKPAHSAGFCF